jgi:hypothetical protein
MPRYQAGLTQHEAFNKKADCVMTGAVYSNVQSSTYIRARQQLECNGFTRPPKHLQEFDLDCFAYKMQEMDAVLRYIRRDPFFENNMAIAYRFFHYTGETRTIHGVIVTDSNHRLLRRFDREDLDIGRNGRSASVLDFCLPYISLQDQPVATAAL